MSVEPGRLDGPPVARRALRPVLRLLWRTRGRALGLGAALAAATALAGMALLGLSGWFIGATAFAGASLATAVVFDVFAPSAGIRLLALGRTGLRYAERLATHDATLAVLAGLREQLFRGWAQPRAARRLLARPARLLFRLTADVDALDALYLRVAVPLATLALAAAGAGLALGLVAPWAGLALVAGLLPGGAALAWRCALAARRPARRRAQAHEQLRALGIDLVAGQTELAMAGRLGAQCQAIAAADARLHAAEAALNRLEARTAARLGALAAAALAGALLLAGWLVEQGRVGVPVAACLVLLVLGATEPLGPLRRGALDLGRALLAARRLGPRLQPQPDAVGLAGPPAGLALRLDQVHTAPAGAVQPVLHGCSLQLRTGERVALVGASGAGKSTLLALAAGELMPRAGSAAASPACLMTQRSELFADSLRDNLLLARPGADDAALWQAL
ncbi:ATP-binding cassette domain-containing protein, partial [Pseudorhodoferax sp.]|uniref:ATP-binding cassette domain-containing protein n=1 Tax=Pseudorhodoferax sp. TaxID=1993553 RepID=UPI002DD62A10